MAKLEDEEKCPECCGWGEIIWDDSFGMSQASECNKCKGSGKKLMNTV